MWSPRWAPIAAREESGSFALAAIVLWGAFAYSTQLYRGLAATGMRDYVSWGMYMSNFVFFIGISHAGTLISAILRVTNAQWRRPITRMAEAITVFALIVGASMVIIDMGRPDRIHHVILYGRLQSPILWDVCSICTYLCGSLLYLYVAMIPDMTTMAEVSEKRGRMKIARLYRRLSLGFRATPQQTRRLNVALATMAVIIIPVAVSVHTVVSWVFAMTLRPGWHSTIFGPYFVVGAIYSGTAAIILAMALFRKGYRLQRYLTNDCFRLLGKLLLAPSIIYIYFTLSEYVTAWYGGLEAESRLLRLLMGGAPYGPLFWATIIIGLFVPAFLLAAPVKVENCLPYVVTASVLVNIGMWLKRYLIIVPTMETPFIPSQAAGVVISYVPTWVEWSITTAAFAAFILLYMLFSKVFPILSMWEIAEPHAMEKASPEDEAKPGNKKGKKGIASTGAVVGLIAAACTLAPASRVLASSQNNDDEPKIAISKFVEDDITYITAEVTVDGEPVEGLAVTFSVVRSFGLLQLGSEATFDDGTAAVEFPFDLPGNERGEIEVVATIEESDEYSSATARATLPGARIIEPQEIPFPQALWSARPLWPLVIVIAVLLAGVWSTYGFVVVLLSRIAREEDPQ